MGTEKSAALYKKAKQYFPGGVNSPVRAFGSVGGTPLFIEKGEGCHIWDADGNKYIDFCGSWGPLILGHAHPSVLKKVEATMQKGMSFGAPTQLENELGEVIVSNHRFIEKIRFVNSGTEATMSAIRLARGYTGRDKIIKFEGCYHGHADHLLVKAGSGLATFGTSSSAGVPEAFAKETIVLPLDDEKAVEEAFAKHKNEIAAVIIEPIPANNGLLRQREQYLRFLRDTCTQNETLLIFDEVISGFRIGYEGAAGYYNLQPDIVTYGKIIGGGMPVGAYGSSNKIMSKIAPEGDVYQAGTLSGNPVAMAAGIAQLSECLASGFYENLKYKTKHFVDTINSSIETHGAKMFNIGSIFYLSMAGDKPLRKASDIDASKMETFAKLYHSLLNKGIYIGPSGYEVGFVSAAHTKEDLDKAAEIFIECIEAVMQ